MATFNFMNEQVQTDANLNPVAVAPIISSTSNSSGSLSNVVTGAYKPYTPTVIQPAQTTAATNLNLPQPDSTGSMTQANATVAGATQTAGNLQSYVDKLSTDGVKTPITDQNKALIDRLSTLYGQDVGKAAALDTAEKNAGVPQMQQELQNISGQILTKNAEYAKIATNISGEAIPMELIRGQQAQAARQQASEIGLLTARAQALQGNIQLAIETATKAVNLQFAPIEEEIAAKEKQLQLIQPLLTAEQKKIADAQSLMLTDQANALAEQKAQQQAAVTFALQNKITTPFWTDEQGKTHRTSDGYAFHDPQEFFAAGGAADFSNAPRVSGTITQAALKSSDTQIVTAGGRELLVNRLTGETIKDLGAAYKTGSGSGGGTPTLTDSVSSMAEQLSSVAGGDGYVSPQDWKTALAAWQRQGYSAASFKTNFENYINPADPQDYK